MKKILIVCCILFLTGCSNELICTMKTEEENYQTEQKISFEFDKNDKVTDATVNYIMTFETEEEAKTYMNIFSSLEKDYEIKIDGKKINIVSTKNYEKYKEYKNELQEDLENNGYSCK